MTSLFIRYEMVKALSVTESFMFVAGEIFGTKVPEAKEITTAAEMMAFARGING